MKIVLTKQEKNYLDGYIELLNSCPCNVCSQDGVNCQTAIGVCNARVEYDKSMKKAMQEEFYIKGKQLYLTPELLTYTATCDRLQKCKHSFQKALDEYNELVSGNSLYEFVDDENKCNTDSNITISDCSTDAPTYRGMPEYDD